MAASSFFIVLILTQSFNTQPPEGGCFCLPAKVVCDLIVSTHSHPKVAAASLVNASRLVSCFNTQPPEGGCITISLYDELAPLFQHTATRRWLHYDLTVFFQVNMFQHTATRRWLLAIERANLSISEVSTHSHPKVAASATL